MAVAPVVFAQEILSPEVAQFYSRASRERRDGSDRQIFHEDRPERDECVFGGDVPVACHVQHKQGGQQYHRTPSGVDLRVCVSMTGTLCSGKQSCRMRSLRTTCVGRGPRLETHQNPLSRLTAATTEQASRPSKTSGRSSRSILEPRVNGGGFKATGPALSCAITSTHGVVGRRGSSGSGLAVEYDCPRPESSGTSGHVRANPDCFGGVGKSVLRILTSALVLLSRVSARHQLSRRKAHSANLTAR
jgi:hypothetical protein